MGQLYNKNFLWARGKFVLEFTTVQIPNANTANGRMTRISVNHGLIQPIVGIRHCERFSLAPCGLSRTRAGVRSNLLVESEIACHRHASQSSGRTPSSQCRWN